MVKGSSKVRRSGGISLQLECRNEELSEAQICHRKKQLEDLLLLQGALQLQINPSKDGDINLHNGGPLLAPLLPPVHNSVDGNNIQPAQFLQYILTRKANEVTESAKKKKTNWNKTSSPQLVDGKKQNSRPSTPQPSLTQKLRATRKTTGSLPPPKVDSTEGDNEPEIEVIQETRNTPTSTKTTQASSSPAYRNIAPKQPAGRTVMKPVPKANNLLLLNITVRPRNAASVTLNASQRKELDAKVKVVLMKTPSEFVEWLLKQGLIRSQQFCSTHKSVNRQPTKLKLGMFQDPKVLTASGSYVWVSECCGRKYISVYSGSVFGSTPVDKVPPTSVLKLIYHWACQTSVANVETWVKVDKQFISKVYNYLRCICSIILHDKIYDFGFEGTMVELGIVSLGTTTADGSRKAVKVEILGLYDRKNKSYRLFASTPEPATNSKERFMRILKPVKEVVHRNAIIICDQSVDPSCLHAMNFSKVEVCTSSDNENDLRTNSTIMYYLRKHVPKMFQAALSQLTEHQVQLTLDELCWREKLASTSASCYDNIMENISYITYREMENPGVIPLLEYVADYPHNNFRYKNLLNNKIIPSVPASIILAPTNGPPNVISSQYIDTKIINPQLHTNKVMTKNIQYPQDFAPKEPAQTVTTIKNLSRLAEKLVKPPSIQPAQPSKVVDDKTSLVDLEPYFYGRIEGDASWGQDQNTCVFKCHICSDTFDDNIVFYAHLKYHIEGITIDKEKLDLMCPFCCKYFESVNAVNKHKIDVHLMSDLTQLWCRICSEKFSNEDLLKSHMIRRHTELELPYRCEVCHFATSFYYEIVNHFNKSHKGTPYVQCHYCLNVKTITPNGAMSFSTRMFQHMQKHIQQKLLCRNCMLTFYSRYLLNEHRKEHLSCANVNGVSRYESPNGYRTLQFRPSSNLSVTNLAPSSLPAKQQIALSQTLDDHSSVTCDFGDSKFYCIECDAPLHTEAHFKKYRKCTRCVYSTCCPNMIMKHAQVFHPSGTNKPMMYFIGAPIPLSQLMFCWCGFSSKSGHHLARHLAKCNKKTGYPCEQGNEDNISLNSSTEPMEVDDGDLPVLPLSVEIEEV